MTTQHSPRWALSTIPHSGTRYVRDSFIDAGYTAAAKRKTKYMIDGKVDLMWGHCERGHENWMEEVRECWPDMRHFIVVRDPLHTLCTHFRSQSSPSQDTGRQAHAMRLLGNSLDLYRRIQETYIERFDPHIHKVEDPIATLGDWAGVELKEGSDRYSNPTELQQAADDRDLDHMLQIMPYGSLLEWFITEYSANIAPLYRDKLGYDFWWYNG